MRNQIVRGYRPGVGRVLAVALFATLASVSCNDREPTAPVARAVTTIDVTLASSSLEVGQFSSASAVALDQYAAPIDAGSVAFASSNADVAAISPTTGAMLALAPGTTQIMATIGGRTGQRTVVVSNAPAIRVNEIKSSNNVLEWVEFYNPTSSTVDLSGWTIEDGQAAQSFRLPAGATIRAGEYFVLDASPFPNGVNNAVRLFSRFGVFVDGAAWLSEVATTYGRCRDGVGDFQATTAATKGAPNACGGTTPR